MIRQRIVNIIVKSPLAQLVGLTWGRHVVTRPPTELFCIQVSSQWLDSGLPPSVVTPVKALETVENERSLSGLSKEAQEQYRNATQPKVVR